MRRRDRVRLVIVHLKHVERVEAELSALRRCVADDARQGRRREQTLERLRVNHAGGVAEREDAEDVAGVKADVRRLHEVHDAVVFGNEWQVRLRDLFHGQ